MGGSGENGSLERDGTNKRDLSLDTQPPTKKKKKQMWDHINNSTIRDSETEKSLVLAGQPVHQLA